MVGRVGGGVEDTVDGIGAWFQDACGGVVLKVLLAYVQDVVAGDEVLDEEVAIFVQSLLEFGEWGVFRGGAQAADVLVVDVAFDAFHGETLLMLTVNYFCCCCRGRHCILSIYFRANGIVIWRLLL